MNLRQLALVGLATLAVGGTAAAQSGPATPPPPPAPNGNVATPGTLLGTPSPATLPPLNDRDPGPERKPGARAARPPQRDA